MITQVDIDAIAAKIDSNADVFADFATDKRATVLLVADAVRMLCPDDFNPSPSVSPAASDADGGGDQ